MQAKKIINEHWISINKDECNSIEKETSMKTFTMDVICVANKQIWLKTDYEKN